jgi:glutamate-5-semialdehyde dehydrogenase
MEKIAEIVNDMGKLAKNASYRLANISSEEKNQALEAIAQALADERSRIKAENLLDINNAKEAGLSPALIDRLVLSDKVIDSMIASVKNIINLPDPIGKIITQKTLDNNILLKKIRVPIGVIAIIFESRPNVISDVAALCLKSGNAVILRGGKEAEHSNRALASIINQALEKINFSCPFAVQLVPMGQREAVHHLCQMSDYVDLIIPRGGESLIRAIADSATVPVIKHYKGVCHVYVDESADQDMALNICHNAKCQRPSACNAAETILVHENIAHEFLAKLADLFNNNHVEMRGCARTKQIIKNIKEAQVIDWTTEYLDLIIAIKIVKNLDEAIYHINNFGSHHSDAIVSSDQAAQKRFAREIDSACVYINASTRFTDGQVFGLGAEMGISTDKLHARGPMGLNELCSYKWLALGDGQIQN